MTAKPFYVTTAISYPNGRPHIGIVSDRRSPDGARPLMIHNIGGGAREEDVLFGWRITGHFRAF